MKLSRTQNGQVFLILTPRQYICELDFDSRDTSEVVYLPQFHNPHSLSVEEVKKKMILGIDKHTRTFIYYQAKM